MSGRDSSRSHIHMTNPRTALFFESWTSDHLPDEDIAIAPEFEPINPEDEDDVVPDQHAAFGILLAQLKRYRPAAYTSALHGGSISAASAASAAAAIAAASPGTLPMSFLNASAWKDLDLLDLLEQGPEEGQDEIVPSRVLQSTTLARISSVAEYYHERREDLGAARRAPTMVSRRPRRDTAMEGDAEYARHARSSARAPR
ncbi:Apc13p protein-domain-containing protein [Kockiozyma suomiensis]|uniref:Apc13p protein-domain-containing protein n=1 Tax=Kockiozyma suomiensis TaxID=1337062 RepID=UPI00334373CE